VSIVDLGTGQRRVVSSITGGVVTAVAAGLLTEAGTRPDGDPDFGPWPNWLWWLIGGGALALVLVTVVLVWVARWAIRVNRRPLPG
jgi:sterol desaturase/sphingolipid hydroxylase (fatty acid hydroxylase superfamily)